VTPHTHTQRVYYADTDAGGVVYHAAYLTFAEHARTEALRALGLPHARLIEAHRCLFVVRRVDVTYLRPARLDDLLTVRTESLARGSASLTLRQTIGVAGATVAVLDVELVCVEVRSLRPVRIPEPWFSALAPAPHEPEA
jgi:acyl-CoA thioester hydrolase